MYQQEGHRGVDNMTGKRNRETGRWVESRKDLGDRGNKGRG